MKELHVNVFFFFFCGMHKQPNGWTAFKTVVRMKERGRWSSSIGLYTAGNIRRIFIFSSHVNSLVGILCFSERGKEPEYFESVALLYLIKEKGEKWHVKSHPSVTVADKQAAGNQICTIRGKSHIDGISSDQESKLSTNTLTSTNHVKSTFIS